MMHKAPSDIRVIHFNWNGNMPSSAIMWYIFKIVTNISLPAENISKP